MLRGAGLGPPVGYLYWSFWGGTAFVDHLPAMNRLLAVPGQYFFCGSFASNEQITGRSGAVLLLRIICIIHVLCYSWPFVVQIKHIYTSRSVSTPLLNLISKVFRLC